MPLGPWELAIILMIVLVIFGAGKLAQVGGALGKSVQEFKAASLDEASAADDNDEPSEAFSVDGRDGAVRP